ncbi:TetR/AcrR family transcriptional regulator [Actinacidiphila oryziradicis]|uniref:TetR/AcrR family transcriptional regulator n=1 Tax=Actinacidiphila oryziradicis TaxID=2571141 RepID=A0A4U0SC84_9ACTN|nr:TetR/AcrR family transcriptional regulator [Actinacidiphila oryziradicis]TKA06403.1 TetR/AcrR family transcriptional regulator [Actinacidiphila oryziradicis]
MAKLSDQRIHDRRNAIIEGAKAVFAAQGFTETSMADIVRAAGVATGTVYRYFDSKEAVVMAVSESAMGSRYDSEDAPPALPDAIEALIGASTDRRRGRLSNQVWGQAAASSALQAMIADRHAAVSRWLARSIDRHHLDEPGHVAPTEPSPQALHRAEVIICAISGLQQRIAEGVNMDVTAFSASLLAWAAL